MLPLDSGEGGMVAPRKSVESAAAPGRKPVALGKMLECLGFCGPRTPIGKQKEHEIRFG